MTHRQHLEDRDPQFKLTGTAAAVSYHFRGEREGWAICTVNDATGELSIQSDWGSWQHRWSTDPAHLGAPSLTAFLRDREAVDYLYDKLHYGRTRGRFSAELTVAALKRRMIERHHDNVLTDEDPETDCARCKGTGRVREVYSTQDHVCWESGCRKGRVTKISDEEVVRRMGQVPSLAEAWSALGALDVNEDGSERFFRDMPGCISEEVTTEPWELIQEEEPWSSTVLREAILPAFIAALNAQPEKRACPMRSSVTGKFCLLLEGHDADTPTRFHRFGAP